MRIISTLVVLFALTSGVNAAISHDFNATLTGGVSITGSFSGDPGGDGWLIQNPDGEVDFLEMDVTGLLPFGFDSNTFSFSSLTDTYDMRYEVGTDVIDKILMANDQRQAWGAIVPGEYFGVAQFGEDECHHDFLVEYFTVTGSDVNGEIPEPSSLFTWMVLCSLALIGLGRYRARTAA